MDNENYDEEVEAMDRGDFFELLMDSIRVSYPEIYEVYDNYLMGESYDQTSEAIGTLTVRK